MPADREELFRRMRELEERVGRLEQRFQPASSAAGPAEAAPAQLAVLESAAAVPALGRAVLAIAGAYVLRALTEAHSLPPEMGVFAGIAYAVFWLVRAARIPPGRRPEILLYSLTSALVLGPLLWESTLRLRLVGTWIAAGVLLLFAALGLILSWGKPLLTIATVSVLAGILTAAALLIGSRDVLPFLFLLLGIAAAVELSACLGHRVRERWLTAVAADLVILLATYLVANVHGLPQSYAPIPRPSLLAAQIALPAIYLASAVFRTFRRSATFGSFEGAQIAIAFLIAAAGGLRLGGFAAAVAVLCLASSAVCYAAGFAAKGRDSRAYPAFGFFLALAGIRIVLPPEWAAAAWSALALGFMSLRRPALQWHGWGYLLFALGSSGALTGATQALLGGHNETGPLLPLAGQAAVALACLWLAFRSAPAQRALRMAAAGAAFWSLAGLGAMALTASYHTAFGALAPHAYCAAGRTAVLAGGAVLLAWIGSRQSSFQITPLIYPVMALAAYRLLAVDLRQDNKPALVISMLVYGAALLLIPRFLKPAQTTSR